MATEKFANNASSTLSSGISDTDLSLTVSSASSFPTSGQFRIKIENEILLVTSVASNVFTVSRGQESTSAASHNSGSTVTHILTAGAIKYISPSSYTEPVYIADPTNWIDTGATLPAARSCLSITVTGDYIYLYGGLDSGDSPTNTIWSAPVSNPTNVTNTGNTLPFTFKTTSLFQIGSYLYLFGIYYNSVSRIYRTSIGTPTTGWTDVGSIPGNQIGTCVIIGSNLYMLGGRISGSVTDKILSASTSDPTTWSDTTKTLPIAVDLGAISIVRDKIYIIGGGITAAYSSQIFASNIMDPTTWQTCQSYLKTISYQRSLSVNNSIYCIGGYANSSPSREISISSDTTPSFTITNSTGLPYAIYDTSNLIVIDGYCYLYGGTDTSANRNYIIRSKNRIVAMAQSEIQSYMCQTAILPNGTLTEYNVHQKSRISPWLIDTYAPKTSF